jgi:transcriptional antiterminator RfaH
MSLGEPDIIKPNWYTLRSKPKKEFFSAALLSRAGIEVYVPELRVQKQRGKPAIAEPFFPGYFFGRLSPENGQIRMASYTPGIMYVLGYELDPCPVPDSLVESIRLRLSAPGNGFDEFQYQQGEAVVVTSGPFRGLEALFDCRLSAKGRVRILIKTMNRLWRAEAHIGQLRRAS